MYLRVAHRSMLSRIFKALFRRDYGYGITKNDANGNVFGIGRYF